MAFSSTTIASSNLARASWVIKSRKSIWAIIELTVSKMKFSMFWLIWKSLIWKTTNFHIWISKRSARMRQRCSMDFWLPKFGFKEILWNATAKWLGSRCSVRKHPSKSSMPKIQPASIWCRRKTSPWSPPRNLISYAPMNKRANPTAFAANMVTATANPSVPSVAPASMITPSKPTWLSARISMKQSFEPSRPRCFRCTPPTSFSKSSTYPPSKIMISWAAVDSSNSASTLRVSESSNLWHSTPWHPLKNSTYPATNWANCAAMKCLRLSASNISISTIITSMNSTAASWNNFPTFKRFTSGAMTSMNSLKW